MDVAPGQRDGRAIARASGRSCCAGRARAGSARRCRAGSRRRRCSRALRRAQAASGPIGYRVADGSMAPVLFRRGTEGWRRVDAPDSPTSMMPDDILLAGGTPLLVGASRAGTGANLALAVARVADGSVAVTPRPAGIRGSSHLRAAVSDGGHPFAVGWTRRTARSLSGAAPRQRVRRRVRPARDGRDRRLRIGRHPPACRRAGGSHRGRAPRASPIEVATSETSSEPAAAGVRFRDVAGRVGLGMMTPTYGGVGCRSRR